MTTQRPRQSSVTIQPSSRWCGTSRADGPRSAVPSDDDAAVDGPVSRHGLREAQLLDEVSDDLSAVLHGVHHCTLD